MTMAQQSMATTPTTLQTDFDTIIELQISANLRMVGSHAWLSDANKYDYVCAIRDEVVEASECSGWSPWWKKNPNEIDLPNLQLELIDILHFHISHFLQLDYINTLDKDASIKRLSNVFANVVVRTAQELGPWNHAHLNTYLGLVIQGNDQEATQHLLDLMIKSGMSIDVARAIYIAKNTLNRFRINNGYKDGTYSKIWAGLTDTGMIAPLKDTASLDGMEQIEDNYIVIDLARMYAKQGRPVELDTFYSEIAKMYTFYTGKESH